MSYAAFFVQVRVRPGLGTVTVATWPQCFDQFTLACLVSHKPLKVSGVLHTYRGHCR